MDYDLIVVGAGTAGMPAAIFAARRGARVCLIERAEAVGGCMRINRGQMSGAGTRLQAQRGITDTPDLHYQDVMRPERRIGRSGFHAHGGRSPRAFHRLADGRRVRDAAGHAAHPARARGVRPAAHLLGAERRRVDSGGAETDARRRDRSRPRVAVSQYRSRGADAGSRRTCRRRHRLARRHPSSAGGSSGVGRLWRECRAVCTAASGFDLVVGLVPSCRRQGDRAGARCGRRVRARRKEHAGLRRHSRSYARRTALPLVRRLGAARPGDLGDRRRSRRQAFLCRGWRQRRCARAQSGEVCGRTRLGGV